MRQIFEVDPLACLPGLRDRHRRNPHAERIRSSQSRVAKMEADDPSVSLDLLVRTLLASGSSGAVIASAFTTAAPRAGTAR